MDRLRTALVPTLSTRAGDRDPRRFPSAFFREGASCFPQAARRRQPQAWRFWRKIQASRVSAQARAYAGNEALKRVGEAVDDLLYIPVRDGVVASILYGGKLFLSASGAGVPARDVLGKAGVAVIDHARSGLSGDAWEIAACFPEKAFSIAT